MVPLLEAEPTPEGLQPLPASQARPSLQCGLRSVVLSASQPYRGLFHGSALLLHIDGLDGQGKGVLVPVTRESSEAPKAARLPEGQGTAPLSAVSHGV